MNPVYLRLADMAVTLLVGLLMLALPRFVRRGLLFGVPVPEGFRERPEGRQAIADYQRTVAVALASAMVVVFFLPLHTLAWARALGVLILMAAPMWAHAAQARKLAPWAVTIPQASTVDLSASERLPIWFWINALVPTILCAMAVWAYSHWDAIPHRLESHWGMDGHADAWRETSARAVFGPLIQAGLIWAWLVGLQLATWYASRRRKMRDIGMLFGLVVSMFAPAGRTMGLLLVVAGDWVRWMPMAGLVAVIGLVVLMLVRSRSEGLEPTPNECWGGGMIYYNPDDAALVVERRDSLGWTFNMANTWAWLLLGGLAVIAAAGPLILP